MHTDREPSRDPVPGPSSIRVVQAGPGPATGGSTDPEAVIDQLLGRLTIDEKITLTHGATTFNSGSCLRLGIPGLKMSDGPHGVRPDVADHGWDSLVGDFDCTYLPTGTALAATWNPQRARDFGLVLGAEARQRGKDVILGPGINIIRTPLNGRNFEYFGEDPFLIRMLVGPVIQAIQSNGVAACVKHFALNNQEMDRGRVNVELDERTLREIYLPGFAAAVDAGVLTVMGAYNQVRGQFCCHNST